ncbi:hypothetical protein FK535_17565 [Mycolicibacterium sp. 018/SC-01/001]|uniref:hypothetical protein n=1 Tax=Mycolicibacterium sp. 018/SC-01/001 TaxID=2592069 RepID=UPI001180C72C|nr:hypothetical protein [Mycolicibacterium sp. 018/SC-01/001]TRW81261.1 hypothetical protein FK535_17565 [Mycolicibacterium sp. 018/SC-01/001]
MSKGSDDLGKGIGGLIVVIFVLIALVPKEVWIFLGALAVAAFLIGVTVWGINSHRKAQAAADERLRAERKSREAAAKRERRARALKAKQQRIRDLGQENAAFVESTLASVRRLVASEAARDGWLGDVDFTADITAITENFKRAHSLRHVAEKLASLDDPSEDDRKLLAEAMQTIGRLESAAGERVALIERCAAEATLIDKSLEDERKDARTAEQRAELHGQLSAMLYGIEATPDTTITGSAADGVMARVMAYREIKNQIQLARDSDFR